MWKKHDVGVFSTHLPFASEGVWTLRADISTLAQYLIPNLSSLERPCLCWSWEVRICQRRLHTEWVRRRSKGYFVRYVWLKSPIDLDFLSRTVSIDNSLTTTHLQIPSVWDRFAGNCDFRSSSSRAQISFSYVLQRLYARTVCCLMLLTSTTDFVQCPLCA